MSQSCKRMLSLRNRPNFASDSRVDTSQDECCTGESCLITCNHITAAAELKIYECVSLHGKPVTCCGISTCSNGRVDFGRCAAVVRVVIYILITMSAGHVLNMPSTMYTQSHTNNHTSSHKNATYKSTQTKSTYMNVPCSYNTQQRFTYTVLKTCSRFWSC